MSQPTRRTASAVALAVALALGGTACSGADDQGSPASADASSTAEAPPAEVATAMSFGAVEGRLPAAQRRALTSQVQQVVDGWIDAAYLGDYPRSDFSDAWPGFTAGARARAERDTALTSNSDLGPSIDGVEVKNRKVTLDVLATRQRASGVTAHVVLRFTTTGETAEDVRVAGRLYLTKGEQGWQVFGYDIGKVAL